MTTASYVSGKPLMAKYTPASAYSAGDVVVVGNLALVAHEDNPMFSGGSLTADGLACFGGEYQMAANGAISVGTYVHYDTSAKQVTPTPTATTVPFGWLLAGPTGDLVGAGPATAGDLCVVLHDPAWGSFSGLIQASAKDALTAFATGGQASALALAAEVNRVTVVATAADSVKLPASKPGYDVIVINSGANPCQVFGAGTDTINDVATATGISQMQNSICLYVCPVAGKWYCEGAATGYSGQLATVLTATGITAFATGGQASAVALAAQYNRVSTVATQGDSVRLPASAVGLAITVDNQGANPCQVFGAGTDTINGIATATGVSHGVKQIATYYCFVAGNWEVQFGQPQQAGIVTLSTASPAIPSHVAHTYVATRAGVVAATLAAPTAGTDDGLIITVTSDTAFAHTITATGLLDTGSASVNVATFAAQKGAGLTLMAYNGRWKVLSQIGITFS